MLLCRLLVESLDQVDELLDGTTERIDFGDKGLLTCHNVGQRGRFIAVHYRHFLTSQAVIGDGHVGLCDLGHHSPKGHVF